MSKPKTKYVEVLLTGISHKGQAVGRSEEGEVIFTQGGVPGDKVLVALNRKRKGVWNGMVTEIIEKSEDRVEPTCQHFGVCGGCSWQNLSYQKQIQLKEQIVVDAIRRIAKLTDTLIEPILACEDEFYYRNKLEYTFSNRRWLLQEEMDLSTETFNKNALGFHRPGTFDKIVDIQKCHLQINLSNIIRNAIRTYALEKTISFYDVRNHTGMLRNLIVKTNEFDQALIVISFNEYDADTIHDLFSFLQKQFSFISSAYYAINTKKNDSWHDLECVNVFGDKYLKTNLHHVQFCVGPKSFFQTNRNQTEKLYALVSEYSELTGKEIVYDLYCGVGSIGIYLAASANKVIGIEEIPEAIEDAKINATLNHLNKCHFLAGDVLKLLDNEFELEHGHADLVVLDPPRTGLHPELIPQLIKFAPNKIVYVSCNPATAARDFQLLSSHYTITKVRPVDMFPMTNHIEMVAQLIRK